MGHPAFFAKLFAKKLSFDAELFSRVLSRLIPPLPTKFNWSGIHHNAIK
jgi:hypothetical protein